LLRSFETYLAVSTVAAEQGFRVVELRLQYIWRVQVVPLMRRRTGAQEERDEPQACNTRANQREDRSGSLGDPRFERLWNLGVAIAVPVATVWGWITEPVEFIETANRLVSLQGSLDVVMMVMMMGAAVLVAGLGLRDSGLDPGGHASSSSSTARSRAEIQSAAGARAYPWCRTFARQTGGFITHDAVTAANAVCTRGNIGCPGRDTGAAGA
jgi:hypothetical protein